MTSEIRMNGGLHVSEINRLIDIAASKKIKRFNYQCEEDLPQVDWICHKLGLRKGGTFLLTGYSNAGKTFFATYLALCIQNNLPILGCQLEFAGKALHLDWELGEDAGLYYYKIKNGLKAEHDTDIEPVDYIDMRREFHLDDEDTDGIEKKLVKLCSGYAVVLIDSLIAAMSKTDINDDRCRAYLDMLNRVASATQASIVIIHHEGKAVVSDNLKRGKGSSSIMAAVRGSISLERQSNNEIKLMTGKLRLAAGYECFYTLDDEGEWSEKLKSPRETHLNMIDSSMNQKPTEDQMKVKILSLIDGAPGIMNKAIIYQSKFRKKDALEIIKWLHENKMIDKVKVGREQQYTITSDGKSYLQYSGENDEKN